MVGGSQKLSLFETRAQCPKPLIPVPSILHRASRSRMCERPVGRLPLLPFGVDEPLWLKWLQQTENNVNPQQENTFWLLQLCAPAASVAVLAVATTRAARTSRAARGGEAGVRSRGMCSVFGEIMYGQVSQMLCSRSSRRRKGLIMTFARSRTAPDSVQVPSSAANSYFSL